MDKHPDLFSNGEKKDFTVPGTVEAAKEALEKGTVSPNT
jgi:hypothetical protein